MQSRSYRWIVIVSLLCLALATTACSQPSPDGGTAASDTITIATKPMTEQYIMGNMLAELIEAKTKLKVKKTFGIGGGTSNIQPAMEAGDVDMYPEYTGTGWSLVLKHTDIPPAEELYAKTKAEYASKYGIAWSGLYGFANGFGLAVPKAMADQYHLTTFSDLAKVSPELVLGAEYDFFEREDGFPGLQERYGFAFKDNKEMDIGLKYEAIANHEVDVINIFTTDPKLAEYKMVSLEDDKGYFPTYFAATLTRQAVLDAHPELGPVLESLTGAITNEDMIRLNALVEIDHKDPITVAHDFLVEHGLIS